MKTHFPTAATLAAALAAGLTLVACQPAADNNASAPSRTESRTESSAPRVAEKAADKAADAAITVAVNAALAKDSQLSALRIDVDTVDGRVVLGGTAPNEAARQRATTLAQRVDGVKSVDNRLAVAPVS